MRKASLVLLIVTLFLSVKAQKDTLSIWDAWRAVDSYFPKSSEKGMIDEQKKLKVQNLDTRWYPEINLNAQATYQSDVVQVDLGNQLPFPVDFPSASQNQYKATLDINQMIYDGGMVHSSKHMEQINARMQTQSVHVDLYEVKNKLSDVYFSVLLLRKQKEILDATLQEINKKKQTVQAAVDNGTLLPVDLKNIRAERLQLLQKMDQVENQIESGISILEEFTGLTISKDAELIMPGLSVDIQTDIQRPENELFNRQRELLDANKQVVESQRMPRVFAFGQLGYGKPGLNMLQNEFDSYYIVGAKVTWNIWDWNNNKRKQQELEIQKQIVNTREKTFNKNMSIALARIIADIENYEETMERDQEIIQLREEIIESVKSKLENGVITSTDYISDLNQLQTARLNYEKHKIELARARFQYAVTSGNISGETQ
jgi:outer membrane protein TolC